MALFFYSHFSLVLSKYVFLWIHMETKQSSRNVIGSVTWTLIIQHIETLTGKYDSKLPNVLNLSIKEVHNWPTRGNALKLYKKRARLDIWKHQFSHRVVDTWNSLPDTAVECKSTLAFEKNLDKHWNALPLRYNHKAEPPQIKRRIQPRENNDELRTEDYLSSESS